MGDNTRPQPLDGVTVLDLGQIYQGPYAGFLCAQAGADVIKIEPPTGDPSRGLRRDSPPTAAFKMLNTNKRSMVLNLKSERGRSVLIDLARAADVVIENYAPGVLDRLGVGADVLLAANPRLVYGSATGFGLSGPDRDRLAMDVTVQAHMGVMSVTGAPDQPPTKAGVAIVDFIGGTHLYAGIMTALFEVTRTGRGRVVETSMVEATYPLLSSNLGAFFATGEAPRTGNKHGALGIAPYDVYPAADGHVALIILNNDHWNGLLRAMDRTDLADDERFRSNGRRVKNMAEVDDVVAGWTSTLPRDEIVARLSAEHVVVAPVRDLGEVVNDEHLHHRGALEWTEDADVGRMALIRSAIRFHDSELAPLEPAPELGGQTRQILSQRLGYDAATLDELTRSGVIA